MRRWSISLLLLVTLSSTLPAQQIGKGEYWIYFKDKNNNGYNIGQPESFLSERSLNRRAWQGLGVDETDEPVSMAYLDTLRGMGVEIRHVSRWLNGVAIVNATTQLFDQVLEKTFVDTLPWAPATDEIYFPPKTSVNRFEPPLEQSPDFDYGIAKAQVLQTRTDVLHGDGYTGKGVWVGVLDAGFRNVDSLPSFEPMIDEDRILWEDHVLAVLHIGESELEETPVEVLVIAESVWGLCSEDLGKHLDVRVDGLSRHGLVVFHMHAHSSQNLWDIIPASLSRG